MEALEARIQELEASNDEFEEMTNKVFHDELDRLGAPRSETDAEGRILYLGALLRMRKLAEAATQKERAFWLDRWAHDTHTAKDCAAVQLDLAQLRELVRAYATTANPITRYYKLQALRTWDR